MTSGDLCPDLFAAIAARDPDAVAVLDVGHNVTYARLAERARRAAGWLAGHITGPDDVVAVITERSAAWPAGALATWFAGAAFLAIDPLLPPARLDAVLAQTRPVAVITERRLLPVAGRQGLPALAIDGPLPGRPAPVSRRGGPDDLAYVIYTSGSSGTPKRVGIPHRALRAVLDAWDEVYNLRARPPRALQAASAGFDVAVGDLVRTVATGGCLVTCPREVLLDPPALYDLLRRARVDYAEFTPSLLRPLLRYLDGTGGDLGFMRLIVLGGERWPVADYRLLRRVAGPGVRLVSTYGLTEATIDSTWYEAGGQVPPAGTVPIGKAFPGTSLVILDAAGNAAAEGELYVGGDQLARGYLDDPAGTASRFGPVPGGPSGARLYRTGDLVRTLPSGDLEFLGRNDDLVKIKGVRLHPAEVADVLARHPGVADVVVVPWPAADDGTRLAAYFSCPGGEAASPASLREFALSALPAAMVPAWFCQVEAVPLTTNGKTDRTRLPPPPSDDVRAAGDTGPGGGDLTTAVRQIWSRVLGTEVTGDEQNFFELGGDSIAAARMTAEVRSALGVKLPPGAVFASPTVAGLVRLAGRGEYPVIPVGADRASGPLSPGQLGLWLLDQLTGGLSAYNIPVVIELSGPLRLGALRAAISRLVGRHEALRTAFTLTADGPVQCVRAADLTLEVTDEGCGLDPATWAARFSARPFDTGTAPLIRAGLYRLGGESHQLVIAVHHLACDGRTISVLLTELAEIYSALAAGTEPELAPLPMRYLDFACWYADGLAGGAFDAQLGHWRAALPAQLPRVCLPSAPRETDSRVLRVSLRLDARTAASVRTAARARQATVFAALLAALAVLLHRWTGQDDLVIGVPLGDRRIPGTERLAGFFVSTVAVRVRVAADRSFADVISAAQSALTGAYLNQDLPFEQIAQRLGWPRTRRPFGIWFNGLGPADPDPVMTGLRTRLLDPPAIGAPSDLSLYVSEDGDELRIDVVFDAAVHDEPHVTELLRQFRVLVAALCAEPGTPVLAPRLADATPALTAGPLRWAGAAGDRVAIRQAGTGISYAELSRWAGAVAAAVRAGGAGPGSTVVVYAHRGASLCAAMLGILGAGAAFCVLDPGQPEARLIRQVQAAGPAVLVHTTAAGPLPAALRRFPVIELGEHPEPGEELVPGPAGDIAYLLFTSGTTASPKRVSVGHAPLVNFLDWYIPEFGIGPDDRFALLSGLCYDPVLRDIFTPLSSGAALCVPPGDVLREPAALASWFGAERVTVLHVTPPVLRLLARHGGPGALPAVRLIVCGGDRLSYGDVRLARGLAPGAVVVNGYGTTETPQLVCCEVVTDDAGPAGRPVPLGRAVAGASVEIITADGHRAGVGELGQIVVRGDHLAAGAGPRFVTGDLGRYLPDGRIDFAGRADDQVKIDGIRVEPAETDAAIRHLPGVRDCVTVVRDEAGSGPRLVTYAVLGRSAELSLQRLRAQLGRHLPPQALPSALVLLARLPMTPNGKVDRAALPPAGAGTGLTAAGPRPRTSMELTVAREWRSVLGVAEVTAESQFFEIGGTSLTAVAVARRLQTALRRPVPVISLFEHPTVRSLASFLADEEVQAGPDAEPGPARRVSPDANRRLSIRRTIQSERAHDHR